MRFEAWWLFVVCFFSGDKYLNTVPRLAFCLSFPNAGTRGVYHHTTPCPRPFKSHQACFGTQYKQETRAPWATLRKGLRYPWASKALSCSRAEKLPSGSHAEERHYHDSAGRFLVGREHKMPELGKERKNHVTMITLFHLVLQPIQIQPAVDI